MTFDMYNIILNKINLINETPIVNFKFENINTIFLKNNLLFNESNKNYRYIRYYNPLISYDYKTGHYIGIWDQLYPHLIISFIEVARGIRKPTWYNSDQYISFLKTNFDLYLSKSTLKLNLKLSDSDN
jgi:sulfite reductase alpha subunit-like flavoprotein